jgi:hypothetical protein
VVFTHRLGQRQASVLAARVVEVRLVIYISGSAGFNRRCSLTGMIDIRQTFKLKWLTTNKK